MENFVALVGTYGVGPVLVGANLFFMWKMIERSAKREETLARIIGVDVTKLREEITKLNADSAARHATTGTVIQSGFEGLHRALIRRP